MHCMRICNYPFFVNWSYFCRNECTACWAHNSWRWRVWTRNGRRSFMSKRMNIQYVRGKQTLGGATKLAKWTFPRLLSVLQHEQYVGKSRPPDCPLIDRKSGIEFVKDGLIELSELNECIFGGKMAFVLFRLRVTIFYACLYWIYQGRYWDLLSKSDGKSLSLPLKLSKDTGVELVWSPHVVSNEHSDRFVFIRWRYLGNNLLHILYILLPPTSLFQIWYGIKLGCKTMV